MTDALAQLNNFIEKLTLYREARGESLAGKAAVLAVIRNRANDARNRWPKQPAEVCTQPGQFSSYNQGDPNSTNWPSPRRQGDWAAWLECCDVVDTPLGADPTSGANFYYNPIAPNPCQAWLGKGHTPEDLERFFTIQIGAHRFYRIP